MEAEKPRRRRWLVAAVTVGLAAIAVIVLSQCLTVMCWVGSVELRVQVYVADANTLCPVSGASVALFNGQMTPVEGPWLALNPNADAANAQRATTNRSGYAELSRRFFAAGSEGTFTHSGYIRLSGTWAQVVRDGYVTMMLPVDGQSMRPRSLDDRSPVFVTVLLSESKAAHSSP